MDDLSETRSERSASGTATLGAVSTGATRLRISIFGLGYVGTVTAACFADLGHEVVCVDVNEHKMELLAEGKASIIEQGVDTAIAKVVKNGRLTATSDIAAAIASTDLSMICVGTPSLRNGSLDSRAVETVAGQIGEAIRAKGRFHAVVNRSTVLPGTLRGRILPILEKASGGKVGVAFGLASNPEFMREGTAIEDFHNPPKTVVGAFDERTADLLSELYASLDAPFFRTTVEVAEMVKYTDNVWHALKVSFANEIGVIAKSVGLDSHALMSIFCADEKLNISKAYLKPGFAFGGSCLPKDTRALAHFAASRDLHVPIISNIGESNRKLIETGIEWIQSQGKKNIGFLGFSFKSGTDDLRESPYLEVIERLIGKGYKIKIYDQNVILARLVGSNREYLFNVIPHVNELLVSSPEALLADVDVVVCTADAPEYREAVTRLRPDQTLLDFARLREAEKLGERYRGFSW